MIHRAKKKLRRASAAVEMAVVMPLLLTILFGIIQFGWVFTVRQGMVSAAREGARTAALPGTTDQDIRDRVTALLSPLGITSETVELSHATQENPVEVVTVKVPYSKVSLVGTYFGGTNFDLKVSCSMRKEGAD